MKYIIIETIGIEEGDEQEHGPMPWWSGSKFASTTLRMRNLQPSLVCRYS